MDILLDTRRQASWLIILLGVGLALALSPFASGLLAAPVLYILAAPLHRELAERMPRPAAAICVLILLLVLVVGPGTWLVALLVGQAQSAAQQVADSPLLGRLQTLTLGPIDVGAQLAEAGRAIVAWLGSSALGLIGTVARFVLNLTLAFFGLYFLLVDPEGAWRSARPFIPFSDQGAQVLRDRFYSVTTSTVIGTGVTAIVQGAMVGIAFQVSGLGNAVFWGVVTTVFSVLPLVGSGLVWGPAAIALYAQGRPAAAIIMVIWGVAAVGSVDNLIRPFVYRRYAQIHPMITVVGAVAGVSYFGLLGLLLGPLAISYFFELIRLYGLEYGGGREMGARSAGAPVPAAPSSAPVATPAAAAAEVEGNPS